VSVGELVSAASAQRLLKGRKVREDREKQELDGKQDGKRKNGTEPIH
jgi:hypothetical protein